ncbi:carbohydrate kinase family protein [Actinomadura atramentaria]|uniref:carbohydrate kinase family protein n=1 Tax=Actinomadura atramentaria TaxID=1990 RepID=UPI0003662FE1|nr:PfkB family carbohydrate kinase [Actinomadura atramentaria]
MAVVTLGAHAVVVLADADAGRIGVAPAGCAAGTAVALARLGHDVVSVGAVGDDDLGDLLTRVLAREGVDTGGLVRRAGERTGAAVRPLPAGRGGALRAAGANPTLTPGAVDPGLLAAADAVHLGGPDLTPGLADPAFFAALAAARAAGTVVTADFDAADPEPLRAAAPFLRHCDYVLPDEEQALALTGAADPVTAARRLLAEGPRAVIVTLGEHGALLASAAGVERLPAPEVADADPTGCGDAFAAGFLTALLRGLDASAAARWGGAAAATVAAGSGPAAGLAGPASLAPLLP